MLSILQKKERMIGTADLNTKEYGVPLNRKLGNDFLILLISLMTFLAMLCLALIFVLSALSERWTSGLENKGTIEVQAVNAEGVSKSREYMTKQAEDIEHELRSMNDIKDIKTLNNQDIQGLLEPWIGGSNIDINVLPLPILISFELTDSSPEIMSKIQKIVNGIAPNTIIDLHDEWLSDVLSFANSIRFASIIVALIIALIIFVTISSAIRSRMAVFDKELTLLHHMGASDTYISRQFERFSFITSAKGCALGALVSFAIIGLINWVSGHAEFSLVPDFRLGLLHILLLFLTPIAIVALATYTARITTMRSLQMMP